MTTYEYLKLRINRVDITASKQSGLPPLFYAVKRCYGDDEASNYLRTKQTKMFLNAVFSQEEVFV